METLHNARWYPDYVFLFAADIISTVEFNHSGELLATGDKGGRVVIFQQEPEVKLKDSHLPSIFRLFPREKAINFFWNIQCVRFDFYLLSKNGLYSLTHGSSIVLLLLIELVLILKLTPRSVFHALEQEPATVSRRVQCLQHLPKSRAWVWLP